MPVSKDALKRYRIIDRLLSDPDKDYTTAEICRYVNRECDHVSLRMIQIDILSIEEEFGKAMVRNARGRGTVKYKDQSAPIFYKELSEDEEVVLREALKTIGQIEGLDNFKWLSLLKKRLEVDSADSPKNHLISFCRNDVLKMPPTLFGRLFTAISRRKTIRIRYTPFGKKTRTITAFPYQLRLYNDRWYLLATPIDMEELPYNPEFIAPFPLDRISEKFDYVEDIPYADTPVDIERRYEEIVGVTLWEDKDVESILFAVRPESVDYVRSKSIHATQIQIAEDSAKGLRRKYPSLKDCSFFSIECRPNYELYSRFASFGANLIVLEPTSMAEKMRETLCAAAENYKTILG